MIWLALAFLFTYVITQISLDQACNDPTPYYNNYLFRCVSCDANLSYNRYLQRCVCSNNTKFSVAGCVPCPNANPFSSRDGMECINCQNNGTNGCECLKEHVLVETDILGFRDSNLQMKCLVVKNKDSPNFINFEDACKGGKTLSLQGCSCSENEKESQNICIKDAQILSIINDYKIDSGLYYNNYEEINNLNVLILETPIQISGLIQFYYYKAARDCYYRVNLESCQVIANLCVLRLYDETKTECRLYNEIKRRIPDLDIINNFGWKKNMPWLYYKNGPNSMDNPNATAIIMDPNRIGLKLSFDPNDTLNVNLLQFYMAKFFMNGTLIGLEEVNKEFILCSKKYTDDRDFRRFGNTIINECDINLQSFAKRNYEMYFYEVFLKDTSNNDLFVDIPVVIKNIQANDALMDNWILTRRFFLVDNLLSVQNYSDSSSTAAYITYANRFKFVIQLQHDNGDSNDSKMFVPYIEILYHTRKATDFPTKTNANVAFISEYSMNIDSFMNVCLALVITITVVSFIAAFAQMYTWMKVNPSDLYSNNYFIAVIVAFLFRLFHFFGFLIFWFIWIISAYWYIFFKLQYRVYLLLPPLETYDLYYKKFDIVFGLGFASFCLYIFYRVYLQATYDIYFVDWEQDKEMLEKSLEKRDLHSTYYRYRGAWRLLQVVNQFFELQKRRNVSFYFCIVWVILMYYRVDWWYNEIQVPRIINIEHSPKNFVLRHFVTSFIILVCGITQFVIMSLVQFWIPLKTVEFLDLCSVSNISVFILTDRLRGYYIHGKSPIGKADANLDELLRFLERESKGKMRERGISDGENADLQSFEMYMSYAMRIIYDGLYSIQVESSLLTEGKKMETMKGKSKLASIFKQLPSGVSPQNNNYFSDYMNNQLKHKIENILLNPRIYVFDKLAFEENICNKMVALFLGYPPSLGLMNASSKDITLFKDTRNNFDEVLFSGIEFEWFIFEVFMLQMWMRVLDNMEIAFFLTFLCDKIICIIRNIFVERNIGKKAGVDTRFIS